MFPSEEESPLIEMATWFDLGNFFKKWDLNSVELLFYMQPINVTIRRRIAIDWNGDVVRSREFKKKKDLNSVELLFYMQPINVSIRRRIAIDWNCDVVGSREFFVLNRRWNCFNLSQECQPPEDRRTMEIFIFWKVQFFEKKQPSNFTRAELFWNCSLRSSSSLRIFLDTVGSASESTAEELLRIDFIDLGFHRTQLWDFGVIISWSSRLDTVLQLAKLARTVIGS